MASSPRRHKALAVLGVVLLLVCVDEGRVAAAIADSNACLAWTAAAPVTLEVDGVTPLLLDERCNGHLDGVQLTLYCGPNASVTLSGWVMEGGAVTVVGPKATPWALTNVSVFVLNSRIHATLGPAVGVLAGAEFAGPGGPSITNLTLSAYNSTLISNTSVAGAAVALGITTAPACVNAVVLTSVIVSAVACSLVAIARDQSGEIAVAAGIAVAGYYQVWTMRDVRILLMRCNTTAYQDTTQRAVVAVGGVAMGYMNVRVEVSSLSIFVMGGTHNAISSCSGEYCVATVGGFGLGQLNADLDMANATMTFSSAQGNSQVTAPSAACAAADVGGLTIGSISNAGTSRVVNVVVRVRGSDCNASANNFFVGNAAAGVGAVTIGNLKSVQLLLRNYSMSVTGSSVDVLAEGQYTAASIGGFAGGVFEAGTIESEAFVATVTGSSASATARTPYHVGVGVASFALGYLLRFSLSLVATRLRVASSQVTVTSASTGYYAAGAVGSASVSFSVSGPAVLQDFAAHIACLNATVDTSAASGAAAVGGLAFGTTTALASSDANLTMSQSNVTVRGTTAVSVVGGAASSPVTSNLHVNLTHSAIKACSLGALDPSICGVTGSVTTNAAEGTCCTVDNTTTMAAATCSTGWADDAPSRRALTSTMTHHRPPTPTRTDAEWTLSSSSTMTKPRPREADTVTASVGRPPVTPRPSTTAAPTPNSSTAPEGPPPSTVPPVATITNTTAPPPSSLQPTPSPPSRSVPSSRGDSPATQAVIVTAYGSSAIAGALSPTAANKPVATGRIVDAVRCDVNGDANEPNSWTLLPGVVWGTSTPASMVVSTIALTVLVWALNFVCILASRPL